MTPQERQLVDELFDRLSQVENQPRDPKAEEAISEGLERAPHAVYALVQTVLVQDEALKMAEQHIRDLGGEIGEPQQRGFLDSVRDTILGPDPDRRGSVPSVGQGRSGVWNTPQPYQQPQYQQPAQDYGRGGGSFLGTAAATAAGVIGGSLLMHSLGSMFGGDKAHAGARPFGDTGRDSTPWGTARDSDLAREAGLDDIGGGGREDRQGFYDTAQHISDAPPDLSDEAGGDGGVDFGGDGGGGGDGGSDT
jgi:hypothetical protein